MIADKKFEIKKIVKSRLSQVNFHKLQFGRIFSDHMLEAQFINGEWKPPKIKAFGKIQISPASPVLHYGQECFEGMKAFRQKNGQVVLFRPLDNFTRLNNSARRLCMAKVSEDIFLNGIKQLVSLDEKWVKKGKERSLYIRPFLISSGEFIVARPSKEYKFFIITSPSQAYYREEIKVIVEEKFTRAAKGGAGFAKAGGNYGASFYATQRAIKKGYTQVIWTDSKEHKYIEESSTMNLMFRIKNTIVTPELSDSILPGITRSSIIQLAKDRGISVEERKISVDEIIKRIKDKSLTEFFGVGTAVTVNDISTIGYNGVDYLINNPENSYAKLLKQDLHNIQYGETEDPYNWIVPIN